jgi:hypothetical protein
MTNQNIAELLGLTVESEKTPDPSKPQESRSKLPKAHDNLRRLLLLAVLYALPACLAITSLALGQNNPDLWWHLRTGQWIVHHHGVPWTDPFSSFGMGKPWLAYSWLYELVLYDAYVWRGLMGPAIFVIALASANGIVLYGAVRRRMEGFAASIALAATGVLILVPFYSAMPVLVSAFLFLIEMDIVFGEVVGTYSGVSGHRLWFLPALFAIWANVHVEFIYGLAALVLAAATQDLELVHSSSGLRIVTAQRNNRRRLWLVAGASFLATLINPYSWRIYWVILGLARDRTPFKLVSELNAPNFRNPWDYVLILVVLIAAFVIGRVHFRGKFFAGLLLAGSTMVSLRAAHDEWVVLFVALLIISVGWQTADSPGVVLNRRHKVLAAVIAVVMALAWARRQDLSNAHLERDAATDFPVKAVSFVRQHGIAGPLFNGFNWGGYLIWTLPALPVSMDGRTNVYGGARTERSIRTWTCMPGWKDDPDLAAANLVIGSTKSPLSYALQDDSRFHVVYRDATAVVFVRAAR